MIITHIPQPMATPALAIVDRTACTGEPAQLLTQASYNFMRDSLIESRLVHHVIVIDADEVSCADCADILAEQNLALYEAQRTLTKENENG